MLKMKSILAGLLSVSLLCGCSSWSEHADSNADPIDIDSTVMVSETYEGYTFEIPKAWEEEKEADDDGSAMSYYDPDVAKTLGTIRISVEDQGVELTEKQAKKALAGTGNNFEDNDEYELISTGLASMLGRDAKEVSLNWEKPVVGQVQLDIAMVYYGSDLITVTYASFPGCHESLRPVFEHLKDTIRAEDEEKEK